MQYGEGGRIDCIHLIERVESWAGHEHFGSMLRFTEMIVSRPGLLFLPSVVVRCVSSLHVLCVPASAWCCSCGLCLGLITYLAFVVCVPVVFTICARCLCMYLRCLHCMLAVSSSCIPFGDLCGWHRIFLIVPSYVGPDTGWFDKNFRSHSSEKRQRSLYPGLFFCFYCSCSSPVSGLVFAVVLPSDPDKHKER